MALGEGVIDTTVDGIIGAYKLLVEPVGRLGLLFIDWNLHGFGFISEEEWQKRESQYCEYANGLTSGISDTLLNVFNFKNLEENTILSPFAYCYNHFGEYISSDASYEDMVDYSKNAVNAFATVAPLAGKAATSLKPKMKNLKSSRPLANAAVSKGAGNSITNTSNKTLLSGEEWNNYFQETYGVENVQWKPRSFEHMIENPKTLYGCTQSEIADMLGDGWIAGSYGKSGTGWKFINDAHPEYMVYMHNADGVHGGAYYGFSSGATGTVKLVGSDYIPLPGDKATIIQMGY